MTSTVLPVLLAHAEVAALTAVVSASPELPIITLSFTGPLLVFWAGAPLLNPPPPQAPSASAPTAVTESRTVVPRALRLVMSCLFRSRGRPQGRSWPG